MEVTWNPWHGCTKYSEGCRNCYVYRQDEMFGRDSTICKKTNDFNLPIKKDRRGNYKVPSGSLIMTCFSSDFLLSDADSWRDECLEMMRLRSDCMFYFFTKRIERLNFSVPDNVIVGCTCENQKMADYRLPIFKKLNIKYKTIILAPMLEKMDISKYLGSDIYEVNVSGESGSSQQIRAQQIRAQQIRAQQIRAQQVRALDYDWVLDIRNQCIKANVNFGFHQTGARFIKDGKEYRIERKYQISQAKKANIDFTCKMP